MARTGKWLRTMGQNTSYNYKGFMGMCTIAPNETLAGTRWAFNCTATLASTSTFTPGSALVKAALWIGPPGLVDVPNVIDDPTFDFVDVMTCPWRGELATSVDIDYLCFAGFGGPDRESKSQRVNRTGEFVQLYITWQSWFGFDSDDTFTFATTGSTDAYVLDAPLP